MISPRAIALWAVAERDVGILRHGFITRVFESSPAHARSLIAAIRLAARRRATKVVRRN
jgi:hypothetical protein